MRILITLLLGLLASSGYAACDNLLDYHARKLHADDSVNLCEAYQGKVLLIVNTASQCGYTPQFKGLEALYQEYKEQGLVVLGFPSDDFRQEFNQEEKTANLCYINYGVTFPMFAPSSVKGSSANAVFQHLAAAKGEPSWNFNKYLLDAHGNILARYPSRTVPADPQLRQDIQAALGKQPVK